MWLLSSLADKIEQWSDPVEKISSYLYDSHRYEIDIFPHGTESNQYLVIDARDNKAEAEKQFFLTLWLLLKEVVELVELRIIIIKTIICTEKADSLERLNRYFTALTNCLRPEGAIIFKTYSAYLIQVVRNTEYAYQSRHFYEDPSTGQSIYMILWLIGPLLLSLKDVRIRLYTRYHKNFCTSIVDNILDVLTKGAVIEKVIGYSKIQLGNRNRVNFHSYSS